MFKYETVEPPLRRNFLRGANIPRQHQGLEVKDLDSYSSGAQTAINFWYRSVKSGDVIRSTNSELSGKGLVLVGEPGHGKTTLASVLLQRVLLSTPVEALLGDVKETQAIPRRPGYFIPFADLPRLSGSAQYDDDASPEDLALYNSLTSGFNEPERNVSVLVVDDLGKEHRTKTGWAENVFDRLLRVRYTNGLPTIITTNVPMTAWDEVYGPSMGSFAHEACLIVPIISPRGDMRR